MKHLKGRLSTEDDGKTYVITIEVKGEELTFPVPMPESPALKAVVEEAYNKRLHLLDMMSYFIDEDLYKQYMVESFEAAKEDMATLVKLADMDPPQDWEWFKKTMVAMTEKSGPLTRKYIRKDRLLLWDSLMALVVSALATSRSPHELMAVETAYLAICDGIVAIQEGDSS